MLVEESKNNDIAICIMYAILFMNDMLCSYIFDTLELIKDSPYYKNKLKFRVKNLETEVRRYNCYINKTKNAGFVADMNDKFQEHIRKDALVAENTIINYLKKQRVPEPDLLGKIAMCDIVSSEAVNTVDDNIKQYEGKVPFVSSFTKLRPTKIQKALNTLSHEVEDTLWRTRHYEVDLSKSTEIINAFKIIRNKLNDPKFIIKVVEDYDANA